MASDAGGVLPVDALDADDEFAVGVDEPLEPALDAEELAPDTVVDDFEVAAVNSAPTEDRVAREDPNSPMLEIDMTQYSTDALYHCVDGLARADCI